MSKQDADYHNIVYNSVGTDIMCVTLTLMKWSTIEHGLLVFVISYNDRSEYEDIIFTLHFDIIMGDPNFMLQNV